MLPPLRLHLLLPSPLLRLVNTPLWPQPQLPAHTWLMMKPSLLPRLTLLLLLLPLRLVSTPFLLPSQLRLSQFQLSQPQLLQQLLPQHTTVDTMVATTHTLVSVLTHMLATLLTHMLATMLTHTTTKPSRYIQTHHHRPTITRGHYQGLSNLVPSLLPCTKRYKKKIKFSRGFVLR